MTGPTAPALITTVAAEVAVDEPPAFVAVTDTTSVEPASAETSVYVCAVAPGIGVQFPPVVLQRDHAYV